VINMLYHITAKEVLDKIRTLGYYQPRSFETDGFIHCSTRDQVLQVANRYYSGQEDLVLLEINDSHLYSKVVYENLEGGSELFPHIYGAFPLNAIEKVAFFPTIENEFSFPQQWFSIGELR